MPHTISSNYTAFHTAQTQISKLNQYKKKKKTHSQISIQIQTQI
jgi:hypothetical protein